MPIWPDLDAAGQHYQPSNGSEGEYFHAKWCACCARDKDMNGTCAAEGRDPGDDDWCQILGASFRDEGAKEWVFDAKGIPTCTAFVPMDQPIPAPRCEHTKDLF